MSSDPIIEKAPNAPGRREMNPLLKFALELGPLVVFFFANNRGEAIVRAFPALGELGGPLFVATALFMAATQFPWATFSSTSMETKRPKSINRQPTLQRIGASG